MSKAEFYAKEARKGARVESTIDEQAELTTVPLTKSTTKPHRFALLRFSLYAYGGNDYAPWGRPEQMLVQRPSKNCMTFMMRMIFVRKFILKR